MDVTSWTTLSTDPLPAGMTADQVAANNNHAYLVQVIAVSLITFCQAVCNHFGIKLTTALDGFFRLPDPVVAVVLTAMFLIWGASWDFSRVTTFVNNTGEAGGGYVPEPRTALIAFLIGLLYPLYTITGFDASAHTSEETRDARNAVPRGMIHSVFWSLVFGFVMALSFVLAKPRYGGDGERRRKRVVQPLQQPPGAAAAKDVIAISIVLANFICALAGLTSTSRMIFAFARDGGLPGSSVWKRVSPTWRTPFRHLAWSGAFGRRNALLAGFAALAAGCALFLYVSYAMPIAAGLLAEGKTWTEFGPFRLGIWSKPLALVTIFGVFVLMYAGIQPPFDILINYAIGLPRPPRGAVVRNRIASL